MEGGHPERHQQQRTWSRLYRRQEVAARERIMWRHLSSWAVSAVMHDAGVNLQLTV